MTFMLVIYLFQPITFDFTGEEFNDNEEFAKSKCEEAFNVCSDVAEDLALAYFNKKRVF